MSKPFSSIEIFGFRGILAPFSLPFRKGETCRSMVVYGANGTGKSSLTDALEWLQSGRIQRLGREGAGPRSYAHTSASADPFVRADVSSPALGKVGLVHQRKRVTAPKEEGSLPALRAIAPHPWLIRSEDLARFVLLRKSERFDELAALMGFLPQVEYQKQLRRVANSLENDREQADKHVSETQKELAALVGEKNTSPSGLIQVLQNAVRALDEKIVDLDSAAAVRDRFTEEIASDPLAAKLAKARTFVRSLDRTTDAGKIDQVAQELDNALRKLAAASEGSTNVERLDLFEAGLKVLAHADPEERKECPLCGEAYPGDLKKHVETELDRLSELKKLQQTVSQKKVNLGKEIRAVSSVLTEPEGLKGDASELGLDALYEGFATARKDLESALTACNTHASAPSPVWNKTSSKAFRDEIEHCKELHEEFTIARKDLLDQAKVVVKSFEDTESRTAMVTARDLIRDVLKANHSLDDRQNRAKRTAALSTEFDSLVQEYVDESINDVQERFDAISEDVARYFDMLESTTPGLGKPALKLLKDQDRAVVLEIEFRGDRIDHAYSYLSQSQLNSFGLAVFLASVRSVNASFPFLVLDDVINSFDAYKRPRLAQLLKEEFDDFQLLVLTHDPIWWDRLGTICPTWVRMRLKRYDLGSGPVSEEGKTTLEQISSFIEDDQPELAGRSLGPLMELELQEMAEAFEALVPFNRRNEYTLDPLLDRVRVRVKEKLGAGHNLHEKLKTMGESTSFRNLCAHWKDPSSPLTREELGEVFGQWQAIRAMVHCAEPTCGAVVAYDRMHKRFVCRCGGKELKKGT